jgi:hypothetical protein
LGTEEALQSGKLFLLKLLDSAVTFSDSTVHLLDWVCLLRQCCLSCYTLLLVLTQ